MISFTCCFIALVVGYFVYGKFIEKIAGVDPKRVTPAFTKQDGVDFLPLPTWKIFVSINRSTYCSYKKSQIPS